MADELRIAAYPTGMFFRPDGLREGQALFRTNDVKALVPGSRARVTITFEFDVTEESGRFVSRELLQPVVSAAGDGQISLVGDALISAVVADGGEERA